MRESASEGGVSAPAEDVCSQGVVSALGGCLLLGGVCSGGCLLQGGVCSKGGVCSRGGWYPSMH